MTERVRRLRGAGWGLGLLLSVAIALLLASPRTSTSGEGEAPAALPLPAGLVREGARFRWVQDGMEMVRVPGGPFRMGSDTGAYDERPAHTVRLSPYWIDRHEVTNAQFAHFVRESGYRPRGPWQRGAGPGRGGHPVRFVTWHDAKAYADWAGRVLPTEAQWELAARGASSLRYPWGNAWSAARARSERAVGAGPAQVGSHPGGASPYGCLDMAGNVWEWVADWYDRRAYRARGDGVEDPRGPEDGSPPEPLFVETRTAGGNERSTRKVVKGGGWVAGGRETARAAKRVAADPRHWMNDTGFRCALPQGD